MKLHLPSGLFKAVIALVVAAAVAPTYAADSVTQNGVTYVRDSADALTGKVEDADGTEKFVSITGNKYFNYITVGDNDENAKGFAQFDGHVMSKGDVTIHSDSFAQVIRGYSFDATGQKVTIGDANQDLKLMDPVSSSTYTQPVYGGVLSFYQVDPNKHTGPVSTLRVGSLQTYKGAYVNDVKTFIVDGSIDAAREVTSSGDMDVRRNGDKNGYILSDIAGNDITIKKGDFSLDTEKTAFNMSSGNTTTNLDPDKMNTGDYGYVKSLTIGAEGSTATAKATNDLQVVNGVTVASDSKLDMNGRALETSSLSGQATNVSSFKVGTFETGKMRVLADYEESNGTKAEAQNFQAKLISTTASASVTNGTMDVLGTAEGKFSINGVNGEGAELVLETGDFILDTTFEEAMSVKVQAGASLDLSKTSTEKLNLDGAGVSALTLKGNSHTFAGVSNYDTINLELTKWEDGATVLNLSDKGSVLNSLTLNVSIAEWNAEEFEAGKQMTLISGLSSASLVNTWISLDNSSTFSVDAAPTMGLALSVKANGDGTYDLVATQAVPEPTTATLSLLALAGLAARRRRK